VIEDYEEMGFQGEEMPTYFSSPSSQIEDLLSEGQRYWFRFPKNPRYKRNPNHSHTTLPGRYLVYMPWWIILVFREGSRMKKNGRDCERSFNR